MTPRRLGVPGGPARARSPRTWPLVREIVVAGAVAVGCERPSRVEPTLPMLPELCVTQGDVVTSGGRARITEASTRGIVPASSGDAASLELTYLGPSTDRASLASGDVRAQVGLKLRAQDSCNLIYVMWRISPVSEVVVQVKRNVDRTTHATCGADGYTRVRPSHRAAPPAVAVGSSHTILRGDRRR